MKMSFWSVLFVTIVICRTCSGEGDSPPTTLTSGPCEEGELCFGDQANFTNVCTTTYNGVVEGGRCFFHLDAKVNWEAAHEECAAKKGFLTQIHSSVEFTAISKYLKTEGIRVQICVKGKRPGTETHWVALKRHANATGTWAISPPYTWWYDNNSTHHRCVSASTTWIRNRETDDHLAPGLFCMVLWHNHEKIGDNDCVKQLSCPLCTLNNVVQTFDFVPKTCIEEPPLEQFNGEAIERCAYRCARRYWCRSFNIMNRETCELFSFVASDTINKSDNPNCLHYAYKV